MRMMTGWLGVALFALGCGGNVVVDGPREGSPPVGGSQGTGPGPGPGPGPGSNPEPVKPPQQPACYNGEPLVCSGEEPPLIFTQDAASAFELHVVGVYEAESQHNFDCSPVGGFAVHVTRKGTHALLLSSYEPVYWVVTQEEGANVVQVVLNGYDHSSADVPAGAKVEEHTYEGTGEELAPIGFSWPDADSKAMVSAGEALTGASFASFRGAYCMNSIVIE